MARHATWVRRPEDSRSPLGWILWGGRQMPSARGKTLWKMALIALGAIAALDFLIGGIGLIVGGALALIGLPVYARPGSREHAALPSLGEGAFPVGIEVRQGGRRVGRDNGWIAFADGWLVYEGLRTSFSLKSTDASFAHDLGGGFHLRMPDGTTVKMGLLTDVIQTDQPAGPRDGFFLLEAFTEWQRLPATEGEAVLPPRETSPLALGEAIGERIAGAVVAALLGFSAALTGAVWPWTFLCGCVGLLLVLDTVRRTRRLNQSLAASDALRVR